MYLEKNIIDKFYLKEKKYINKPKYTTLLLHNLIKNFLKRNGKKTFLDVGCANGAAIEYIKNKFKKIECIGTDVEPRFKNNLRKISKEIKFYLDDVKKRNTKKIYGDIVYCSGVLSLFNDPKILIEGLIKRSRSRGKIVITSMMNPYDLDLIIKFRNNKSKSKKFDGAGWNLHSIYQLRKILEKNKKIKSFRFIKTKFPKKIKIQKTNDQLRSWTIKFNNETLFMNGLCVIQHHYFLIINVK